MTDTSKEAVEALAAAHEDHGDDFAGGPIKEEHLATATLLRALLAERDAAGEVALAEVRMRAFADVSIMIRNAAIPDRHCDTLLRALRVMAAYSSPNAGTIDAWAIYLRGFEGGHAWSDDAHVPPHERERLAAERFRHEFPDMARSMPTRRSNNGGFTEESGTSSDPIHRNVHPSTEAKNG